MHQSALEGSAPTKWHSWAHQIRPSKTFLTNLANGGRKRGQFWVILKNTDSQTKRGRNFKYNNRKMSLRDEML